MMRKQFGSWSEQEIPFFTLMAVDGGGSVCGPGVCVVPGWRDLLLTVNPSVCGPGVCAAPECVRSRSVCVSVWRDLLLTKNPLAPLGTSRTVVQRETI